MLARSKPHTHCSFRKPSSLTYLRQRLDDKEARFTTTTVPQANKAAPPPAPNSTEDSYLQRDLDNYDISVQIEQITFMACLSLVQSL